MQVDWKQPRGDWLPEVVRWHFGRRFVPGGTPKLGERTWGLEPLAALVEFENRRPALNIVETYEAPEPRYMAELAKQATQGGVPALIFHPQAKFRLWPVERGERCWTPAVFWGRKQVEALLDLNEHNPENRAPPREVRRRDSPNSRHQTLSGFLSWSDIVEYSRDTSSISEAIGVNPIEVRDQLMDLADEAFRAAGSQKATNASKVGADGWFHVFNDPDSDNVLAFTRRAHKQFDNALSSDPWFQGSRLKFISGLNKSDRIAIRDGQPYDNDSIIAHRMHRPEFAAHDIRGSEALVKAHSSQAISAGWSAYQSPPSPIQYVGQTVPVHGHPV